MGEVHPKKSMGEDQCNSDLIIINYNKTVQSFILSYHIQSQLYGE
jgi:hypothetical protein